MVAVVWPAGFCLLIFSTGIKRFWQLGLIPLDEPLVNQMKFPCDCKLQDILPVNTTLSKMSSQDVGLLPNQLILEVSGLDDGKFRIVQLPSMLIWEGETGLTKPSITPPRSATQLTPPCACAGVAVNSKNATVNSRIPIQLTPTLLIVPLKVMCPRSHYQANRRQEGPRQSTLWTGFRRSRRRRAPKAR